MLIGTVTEAIVAPTRHPALAGAKLLHVQVESGGSATLVLAVDTVGAGVGDQVIVAFGQHAVALVRPHTPADAVIIGIIE